MTDAKLAEIIRGRWTKLHDNATEVFEQSETYNQLYRTEMNNDDSYMWDYNMVDPVVFYLIRSLMARMNTENMKIRLEARTQEAEIKRKVNQRLIDWELGELKKTLILYNFIYRGLISGRSYLKSGWFYAPGLKVKTDNGDKDMKSIVDRATISNVRFQDILVPNLNIPDMDEQPYVMERMMIQYGDFLKDLKRDEKMWNKTAIEKIKKKGYFERTMDYGIDLPVDSEDDSADKKDQESIITNAKYVAVLRMQTKDNEVYYCLEKDQDLMLNDNHDNPYWHNHQPYITWTPFPEDDTYFSMGVVQPVSDLAISLSSILNQYLTNARKSGNPMWLAGAAAAQTPDWMFVNRPDGIIRVAGDVNQIQQVRSLDTTDTMLKMRQEVMTSFERTSAMSSMYTAGVASGGAPMLNKTAAGAKVIDTNIDTNLQMLISLFSAMALSKIGEHFLELNAQFITTEQEARVVGKDGDIEFTKIKPEEVTANFDCIANGDTMAKTTPTVRQAQLLNLKATMDSEKDVKLDKKPVWKAILNAFPEMDQITDDVIIDPEQQAKEAITLLLQGIEPKISVDSDHKRLIQLVQVFVLSNKEMPDEQLMAFAKYLDNLRKYVEATKVVITLNQPLTPSDPGAVASGMMMPPQNGANIPPDMGGAMNDGKPLPANEADLMRSLNSQTQLATNPTESLPNKLPLGV